MPFKTFNGWLFDGDKNSKIPKPTFSEDGKIITPDILKYNSPITHTYILSLFLTKSSITKYLNKYFNNINLRYLSKKEIFLFIKKCVIDFRLKRRDVVFVSHTRKTKIFNLLRDKCPELKNCDVSLLCEIIDKSNDKNIIYNTLGLEKPKKIKLKKKIKKKKISLNEFLIKYFSIMNLK